MLYRSGSTHGQALALMKQSVKSLLETLGENDFVNVARVSMSLKYYSIMFETPFPLVKVHYHFYVITLTDPYSTNTHAT